MKRVFDVIIEKDETGYFVATVPAIRGCVSQGKTLDEAKRNIVEAIELMLEDPLPPRETESRFVGIHQVEVSA